MRPTVVLTAALSALAVSAVPVFAASLVVPIDHSVRLNVAGSAASVVVGNPQVADVTVVDSHTLFVSGRGYGETDVVVLDPNGRTLYSGDVMVAAPQSGRVSIYRGAERTDLACAPDCSVSTRSPTSPSKEGSATTGGGASSNPLGAALAGAMAGISGAVSHSPATLSPG
jgi:Flp pilus assembly secretin CpaC